MQHFMMCVWMRQFKRVIYLFREIEILSRKMTCFDEEIKRKLKLKLRNFKKVFQITKIVKFQIHSKNKETEIS